MSYRQLKWLALLGPLFWVGVLEFARHALDPVLPSPTSRLLWAALVLAGAVLFYAALFTAIDHRHGLLERQNRELLALRSAGLDIASELTLDAVLQKIVDQACVLLETRYGAMSVHDSEGNITAFVTAGIDEATAERIGPPPTGKGILGISLREGQRLRLSHIDHNPRSCGFPEGHPPMRSLLAVPVICRGPFVGNLYLSEKHDDGDFTADEEDTLARFASQAAIAVDNAHLHAQVRSLAVVQERLNIAHELHDGHAQILAFVNTKAQAVRAYLDSGNTDEAGAQLDQLADAAREVYADVREGILGLRTVPDVDTDLATSLRDHCARWQEQNGVEVTIEADELPDLPADIELQLLRIAQESLTNVRKHAQATRVHVYVTPWRKGVRLIVEDDGVGLAARQTPRDARPRFGLATMRERAEAIGASLVVESPNDTGTRIELTLPGPG